MPPLPFGPVCTVTWMSGFSSFQMSTTFSIPGIHDVKVRSTLPSLGAQSCGVGGVVGPLPVAQPVSASADEDAERANALAMRV